MGSLAEAMGTIYFLMSTLSVVCREGKSADELAAACKNESFLRGLEFGRMQVGVKALNPQAEIVSRGVALFNSKPQRGVQYLVAQKIVEDSAGGRCWRC